MPENSLASQIEGIARYVQTHGTESPTSRIREGHPSLRYNGILYTLTINGYEINFERRKTKINEKWDGHWVNDKSESLTVELNGRPLVFAARTLGGRCGYRGPILQYSDESDIKPTPWELEIGSPSNVTEIHKRLYEPD